MGERLREKKGENLGTKALARFTEITLIHKTRVSFLWKLHTK